MDFSAHLRTLRKQRGLSQEDLAGIVGVSRQAVQKWEAGSARPDLDNLTALARYFNVTLDELVTEGRPPCAAAPTADPKEGYTAFGRFRPFRWHYEYQSTATFCGLPLVHIHLSDRGFDRAVGIIAVGNVAVGLVAVGGFSLGLLSVGGVAVGLLALAGLGLGGFVLGGVAVGGIAIGGCAIGNYLAIGGLAVGNVALGGCAVGDVALGSAATGTTAFSIGNGSPSPQVWRAFCEAVRTSGHLFSRTLADLFRQFTP